VHNWQKGYEVAFCREIQYISPMVVRMRHTRSHTANRRSHHALKSKTFTGCANCGAKALRHTACVSCGTYKGRNVLNVVKKAEKKVKKVAKVAKAKTKKEVAAK